MRYTVLIREGNECGYVATVPALPGRVSQGRTRIGVLKNIRGALEACIEALIEKGLPVPKEAAKSVVDVEITAR